MDRKLLRKIIEELTEGDFEALIFDLEVPRGIVPSAQLPRTTRTIKLLTWADSPTGCSLEKVLAELREMGAIAPEVEAEINPPKIEVETTNHKSFTEKLPNNIDLEMIAIPAGSFMMGSNEDKSEQPIHKVTFKEGFFMGKYPITQAQYEAVMGKNPSYFKGENNPVECVSWNDAQEFCRELSAKTGKKYKLPSESQWEYACRAGSKTRYCFGDNMYQLSEYAWYADNSGDSWLDSLKLWQTDRNNYFDKLRANNCRTNPVGQKKPNEWGLYDMHGNVWEYCEDDWHKNYENVPDDGNAWIDRSSRYIVIRGGSWVNNPNVCRSAYRDYILSREGDFNFDGFRVVCELGRTL